MEEAAKCPAQKSSHGRVPLALDSSCEMGEILTEEQIPGCDEVGDLLEVYMALSGLGEEVDLHILGADWMAVGCLEAYMGSRRACAGFHKIQILLSGLDGYP